MLTKLIKEERKTGDEIWVYKREIGRVHNKRIKKEEEEKRIIIEKKKLHG